MVFGHGDDAVGLAVDDRNGASPVALTRDQPIAHPVVDGGAADSIFFSVLAYGGDCVSGGLAVEEAGIDRDAVIAEGAVGGRRRAIGGCGHARNFEVILGREFEVPLILAGRGHDRAGAIAHQDVVGDPDWDVLAGEDVVRVGAGEDAGLFLNGGHPLDLGLAARLGDVSVDLRALRFRSNFGDERMLRRKHHERDAEDSVGARREKPDFLACVAGDGEGEFGALAAADPVSLHQLDRLGPIDAVEIGEQAVGVVGDLDVPLLEIFLGDGIVSVPPTASVDDLLVGENRLAFVAPPLRAVRAVGESALQEHQEEPLGPLVVLGRRRIDLARPIVSASGDRQLALEVGGVARDGFSGMRALEDGFVLGGEAERVPSHRVQHVESGHPLVTADDVARDVIVQMADAEAGARRIGEHLEDVEFRAAGVLAREVEVGAGPFGLPEGLDCFWVVAFVHENQQV